MNNRNYWITSTFILFVAILGAKSASATTCESLAALQLQDTTITSATPVVPPFTIKSGLGGTATVSTPFCRVIGFSTPTNDSHISFEVWLPPSDEWNHKYEGVGNAGFAGAFNYSAMTVAFRRGYATMTTDQGHINPPDNPIENISWALGHPEKIIDYGYRAEHVSTIAAKKIIEAYYGSAPQHSYFFGCSAGGHQGITESIRFPTDYDGYVVGDAGANHLAMDIYGLWASLTYSLGDPPNAIRREQLPIVHQAVLKQCAGRDGGLASDSFLTDPRACQFNPKELECKAGQDPSSCLSPGQAIAFQKLYQGPQNQRTNQQADFGYSVGSELLWANFIGRTSRTGMERPWAGILSYMVFDDPNYVTSKKYLQFNFDSDFKLVMGRTVEKQTLNSIFSNDYPNLEPVRTEGAKIIHFWGWMDGNDPALHGIDYFDRVVADQAKRHHLNIATATRSTGEFYRLFMVPGMGHCSGGPGPNVLDTLTPLEEWVEKGIAPDKIVATKYLNDDPKQGIQMTRPVCPYPQFARYTGSGPTEEAGSFVCENPAAKAERRGSSAK